MNKRPSVGMAFLIDGRYGTRFVFSFPVGKKIMVSSLHIRKTTPGGVVLKRAVELFVSNELQFSLFINCLKSIIGIVEEHIQCVGVF